MTSEIAILNKTAVALAADSAATIRSKQSTKIYYSVNKIFALSKFHPVGIMIYNSSTFSNIPWETIIKMFRQHYFDEPCSTLEEYGKKFINYIKEKITITKNEQDNLFKINIYNYYDALCKKINKEIRTKTSTAVKKDLSLYELKKVIKLVIDDQNNSLNSLKYLPGFTKNFSDKIILKYTKEIDECIKLIFEKIPIDKQYKQKLRNIAGIIHVKNGRLPTHSGIVIAGFGSEDIFPSVVEYFVETVVLNKLRYQKTRNLKINEEMQSIIIPFAQVEMVHLFMSGIDPDIRDFISGSFNGLSIGYPEVIIEFLKNLDNKKKEELKDKLVKFGTKLQDAFQNELSEAIKSYTNPILDTVSSLPKRELAEMAESLINLTTFKRKVSKDEETVGGPTDVAIISKGDGFIWAKRKNYFDKEKNFYFTNNYFRKYL